MRLGQVLRDVRIEKGYRQNDIAMLLHVDNSAISRFETGKEELKDLNMLVAWADKLGSDKPLLAACEECPIQIRLSKNCSCIDRKLLN